MQDAPSCPCFQDFCCAYLDCSQKSPLSYIKKNLDIFKSCHNAPMKKSRSTRLPAHVSPRPTEISAPLGKGVSLIRVSPKAITDDRLKRLVKSLLSRQPKSSPKKSILAAIRKLPDLKGLEMSVLLRTMAQVENKVQDRKKVLQRDGTRSPSSSHQNDPPATPYACLVDDYSSATFDPSFAKKGKPSDSLTPLSNKAPKRIFCSRSSPFYNAHSYHTKIPPELICEMLQCYTRTGDLVFDPFCGSGMTGVAALISGRNAALSDLSVAAMHLSFNHTQLCDPVRLLSIYKVIEKRLDQARRDLYFIDYCGKPTEIDYVLWTRPTRCSRCSKLASIALPCQTASTLQEAVSHCQTCGGKKTHKPVYTIAHRPFMIKIHSEKGPFFSSQEQQRQQANVSWHDTFPWFPTTFVQKNSEMFIRCALYLHKVERLQDFYTRRNLLALALLWREIQKISDARIRHALSFAFTNTAWHATKMRRFNNKGGHRPLSGVLYFPNLFSEANVFSVMRNKVRQLSKYYQKLDTETKGSRITYEQTSATDCAKIPSRSIDYIFTDPPFGANIFYSDLNFLWESWLGRLTPSRQEAVINKSLDASSGGKDLSDYERLMKESFKEMARVLKPGCFATIIFHNTDPKVWNVLQRAVDCAGFFLTSITEVYRKQFSIKGYKGRSGSEKVAHYDLALTYLKSSKEKLNLTRRPLSRASLEKIALKAIKDHKKSEGLYQICHSRALQMAAANNLDLGTISYGYIVETVDSLLKQGSQKGKKVQAGRETTFTSRRSSAS